VTGNPWQGYAFAFVLISGVAVGYLYLNRRKHSLLASMQKLDKERGHVDEIRIQSARYGVFRKVSGQACAAVFEISEREFLVLRGDSFETCNFDSILDLLEEGECCRESLNKVPFPCADFTIVRWPNSGVMVKVEPQRGQIHPEFDRTVEGLDEWHLNESEILEGKFCDAERLIREENQFRKTAAENLKRLK